MPLTHEQKADLGLRYIDAIKHRIDVRTKAQAKAVVESKDEPEQDEGDGGPLAPRPKTARRLAIEAAAALLARRHRLGDGFSVSTFEMNYRSEGFSGEYLRVNAAAGTVLLVPIRTLKTVRALDEKRGKAKDLARELCQEIEFLQPMTSPSAVALFQAHAARLWAPVAKDERISVAFLSQLIDDFLAAKRPAVCKVT